MTIPSPAGCREEVLDPPELGLTAAASLELVTPETAPLVAAAGANVLVAGSAAFKGGTREAYATNIAAIRSAADAARGKAAA